MRGYAKTAFVGILMMGLLAVPNLSPAADASSNRDGNGRHRLLNAELRSKVEDLRNKIVEHREHQHNQGGNPGSLEALQARVTSLETALAGMVTQASLMSQHNAINVRLSDLDKKVAGGGSADPALVELAKLAKYVTVIPDKTLLKGLTGPHVIFHGANVHVQNGSGATATDVDPVTSVSFKGLGNFVVGYNEEQITPISYAVACDRTLTGSHNIVMGDGNMFTSYGGLVIGSNHCVTGPNTSILGGTANEGAGANSAILGGTRRSTAAATLNQTVPLVR